MNIDQRIDYDTSITTVLYHYNLSNAVKSLTSIAIDPMNDMLLWANEDNNYSVCSKAFIMPFVILEPVEIFPPAKMKSARAVANILGQSFLLGDDGNTYVFPKHFDVELKMFGTQSNSTMLKSTGDYLIYINIDGTVCTESIYSKSKNNIEQLFNIVGAITDIDIQL